MFRQHYGKMYNLARSILSDDDESKDVVSEVFTTILADDVVLMPESEEGFLMRIVRNRCLNYIRDHCSVSVSIEEVDPLSCLYEQDSMAVEDASRIVWEAVRSLPPKSREVFEKSRSGGMSNTEIAASMNLSVKTVEGHMTKALKTIRLALKKNFLLFLISF